MPQLDKFTYFTQFFWSCLLLFTFYISICNDGDGVLGISRILKLRNNLGSRYTGSSQQGDRSEKDSIQSYVFRTAVSYFNSFFSSVSSLPSLNFVKVLSCFGEISGKRGMERHILDMISKSSYLSYSSIFTCKNYIMRIHVLHGQVFI
nr:ATPase subunit 8 [Acorus tatarinowii]